MRMRPQFDRPPMAGFPGERMGPPPREFAMGPRDRGQINQRDRFSDGPREERFAPRPQMREEQLPMRRGGERFEPRSSDRREFQPRREDNRQFEGQPSRRMQSTDESRPRNEDRSEGRRPNRPQPDQE
jgi:hypothetical protein